MAAQLAVHQIRELDLRIPIQADLLPQVSMGFTQPMAKGPRIVNPVLTEQGGVQLTCTMALGYRKRTKNNFDWTVYLITS